MFSAFSASSAGSAPRSSLRRWPSVSSGRSGISTPSTRRGRASRCVVLYTLGQWREIVDYFRRRQARYGAIATVSVLVVLAIIVAVNYLSARAEQAVGPDRQQAEQPVGADGQGAAEPRRAGEVHGVRQADRASSGSAAGSTSTGTSRSRCRSSTSIPTRSRSIAKEFDIQHYGTVVIDYMGRRERVDLRQRAGPDQRADQGDVGQGAQRLLPPGPRRKGSDANRARRLQRRQRMR